MAANLLGIHPEWSPDDVKGELMLSAISLPYADPGSVGVGEVNVYRALNGSAALSDPPNPNAGLEQFLIADPAGGSLPVFDSTRWINTAKSNPSCDSSSWSSASWTNNADVDGQGDG